MSSARESRAEPHGTRSVRKDFHPRRRTLALLPPGVDFEQMTTRKKTELNSALADAVREFGAPTTPHELEELGLRKVRYVPVRKISEMIEKAIHTTILERTIGAVDGDLGALVDQAQAGMLGLLKGVEDVVASQGALSKSRAELMDGLAETRPRRGQASPILAPDPSDPTVQKMIAAIRETFGKL